MKLDANKPRRLLEVLKLTTDYFSDKGIDNPRLNAERLLAHTLHLDRIQLYLHHDRPLSKPELDEFKLYIKRRVAHEPLQYIVGGTEFFSLPFKLNSSVLIPRPETEVLVEKVLAKISAMAEAPRRMLDVGTGSGCIAIALAKHLPGIQVTAIDIDTTALSLARENAVANAVEERIRFQKLDITDSLSDQLDPYDVIVSNPPYIERGDFAELPEEVRLFEPENALHDSEDGLRFYRRIITISQSLLKPDGFVAFEVGMGQAASVSEILQASGMEHVDVYKDLAGHERVVMGHK